MELIGIAMILGIVWLIELGQKAIDKPYARDIEKKHKEFANSLKGNPLVVREFKARTETMVHSGMKEYQQIEYKSTTIKEVTTEEERRVRRQMEKAGKKYVHTYTEEQIEELIEDMLRDKDLDREDLAVIFPFIADEMAETYARECKIDIEDARFAVKQIYKVLKGEEMPVARKKKREAGEYLYNLNGAKMRAVDSSAVTAVGYNEKEMILYVEFTSGVTYEYHDVPIYEYIDFINSKSLGKYVQGVLTLKYEYNSVKYT